MYATLLTTINQLRWDKMQSDDRMQTLQPLIDYVQRKANERESIDLHFICTHNSRRSHLAQVWAQVAAAYFRIPDVHCYSGGTEETALFPMVANTLSNQGLLVLNIAEGSNPIYAIKYAEDTLPIIGFSKSYDHAFNPSSGFAAVMTCSQADAGCPFVGGAEKRIPVTFEDPKISDGTQEQANVYAMRSLEIAREMLYVFSKIKSR
ncbi:low molecular weight phosphatase family protein [Sphingobacterium griseoflavum]|uniref:Arsenate reductase n=1 Tax=Sphingobacterium griseoflavum TaxID=1474952 RepID=A0ABQ3HXJ2_9SPHI|nr:protein-tyrosine-phosphatase [Sphingobacterium griseoflavum]GHE44653.1 arsenate reductase [Sphingobacterium griseoflavum]